MNWQRIERKTNNSECTLCAYSIQVMLQCAPFGAVARLATSHRVSFSFFLLVPNVTVFSKYCSETIASRYTCYTVYTPFSYS